MRRFRLLLKHALSTSRATIIDEHKEARDRMVREFQGVIDENVLNIMRTVPRHKFVPSEVQQHAYENKPLPIGHSQTVSQPSLVALMAAEAQIKSTDKVLEIGTGCGYSAAVFSRLAKVVYSAEFVPELGERAKTTLSSLGYDNVHVMIGDGSVGISEYAPYDAIVVNASVPAFPPSLLSQLAIGGHMIIPIHYAGHFVDRLVKITNVDGTTLSEKHLDFVKFVPLVGKEGWSIESIGRN